MKEETKEWILLIIVSILLITLGTLSAIYFANRSNDTKKEQKCVKSQIEHLKQEVRHLKEIKVRRNSTIATDCNNLGCLRNGNSEIDKIAIGYINTINGKFLVFEHPQDGALALSIWKEQRPDWTLSRAIFVYAPPIENNTNKYLVDMCRSLKVTTETKLKDINEYAFINCISKIEGYEIDKI